VRAEFVGPFGSDSVELLEVATAAVMALGGAAEREAEATRRLQLGNRSIPSGRKTIRLPMKRGMT
jgi:hypothetical protein